MADHPIGGFQSHKADIEGRADGEGPPEMIRGVVVVAVAVGMPVICVVIMVIMVIMTGMVMVSMGVVMMIVCHGFCISRNKGRCQLARHQFGADANPC
jgi:hypothetical protein